MTDVANDEDLDEVDEEIVPFPDQKSYVIHEIELLMHTDWAPVLAERLGYSLSNLITQLNRWERPDLATHFMKPSWDNLVTERQRQSLATRRRIKAERKAAS